MKDPADSDSTTSRWGYTGHARGDQFVLRNAPRATGGVVMRIAEDIAAVPQIAPAALGAIRLSASLAIVNSAAKGTRRCRPRPPDAASSRTTSHDSQTFPRGFGVNRGMGGICLPADVSCAKRPHWAFKRGTDQIAAHGLLNARLRQQRHQMAPQTPDQRWQPRWQFRKAPFPGAAGKRPCSVSSGRICCAADCPVPES